MADVSVCLLTYGDYPELLERSVSSVLDYCPAQKIQLIVGANAPSARSEAFLSVLERSKNATVLRSEDNINKCPMMSKMFDRVESPLIWWFDDDSHIVEPSAFDRWTDAARTLPIATASWGHVFYTGGSEYLKSQARSAPWFKGRPFEDNWWFPTGGCWMAKTHVVEEIGWPHFGLIKRQDDVLFGEALRQNAYAVRDTGPMGVRISDHDRRGVE